MLEPAIPDMIIKGIFKRYERWNPVHPTYGAFWGIGVGIGCGIGWGPGFGPEVIGYVGAGCGAGFHIGMTLLGIGIGFPASYLLTVPHSAFMATKKGALDFAQTGIRNGSRSSSAGDGWDEINSHNIPGVGQSQSASFSGFEYDNSTENQRSLAYVKSMLVPRAEHITGCLQRVSGGFFPRDRGSKS
ncbi:PREDICTED: cadmium-induced protein AS8-like isoform X1 [Erythranthe guttata]|uniref:cadmium-induced protein AS8-like isoform X1 n=1 Tax=Erythranthe guttata TaxID=4155 RepID=UPI00064DBCA4|nr:PREDICTED: cadmium-induced protein AS8-like isoform X1 [Erythranthe guttata]|eukprot:XP_012837402.1 PREDICTED: cadmium-induced protein AS8-like isoform X1 [Erythranthe guttata]